LFKQQKDFNISLIGKTLQVLTEKTGRHDGQMIGRSPYLQSVFFDAQGVNFGDMVNIKITRVTQNALTGDMV
jgi:tRNA-2-methylthio-N6-dimethylallyladenosine synthase